ncbi:MAG: CoA transferase, partial [Bacteroidota bacterium]
MNLLAGLTIVDFTRLLPGPLATHLLAQMGAKVIKIESPERMDYTRFLGPQVDGASVLFHQLNHNKECQQVDYTSTKGRQQILDWLENADVLIEQFRPGAMAAWGLDYLTLKKQFPRLVYVSLTGYGQEGPARSEAGHDFNYLAYAGLMSLLKDESGKPVVPGFQLADIGGAYMAVMALQAALLQERQTGQGSWVDVALTDAVLPLLTVPYALHSAGLDHRQFNTINGQTTANYAAYECADGKWLSMGAVEIKFWNNFCQLVGRPEWQRQNELDLMLPHFPKAAVETLFKSKDRADWIELFEGQEV